MLNKKLTKAEEQLLKAYANHLPVVFQNTHEVHKMTGAELIEMGYVEKGGEKLLPAMKYEYNMPVQLAANHYRRLKNAWLKDGEPGITAYLKEIADLIEKNKEKKLVEA